MYQKLLVKFSCNPYKYYVSRLKVKVKRVNLGSG